MDKDKTKNKDKQKQRDEVTEAGMESFPASDPPASWASAPEPVKTCEGDDEPESEEKDKG